MVVVLRWVGTIAVVNWVLSLPTGTLLYRGVEYSTAQRLTVLSLSPFPLKCASCRKNALARWIWVISIDAHLTPPGSAGAHMRPSPPPSRSRLNSEKKKRKEKTTSMLLAIHGVERIYMFYPTGQEFCLAKRISP